MEKSARVTVNRSLRTLLQAIVALPVTALVNALFTGLDPVWLVVVQGLATSFVTVAQNYLEETQTIPSLLKGD